MPAGVELGPPVSYLTLREGTPVYDRRGKRIGVVDGVLADTVLDIFDGLIIHTEPLPGTHLFAAVDQISELHEGGVLLSVDRDALGAPRDGRAEEEEEPADGRVHALLRRVWDAITRR
jgi:uncharacterized protein YrrD